MIEIRQATPDEAVIASEILTEAASWLIERSEPLWPLDSLTPEKFGPVAERGELYLAWLEGEAVGTISFQWEDKPFWPDVPAGESAFFHKVAVRRKAAGQGVAQAMIAWATEKARVAGMKYLRMDTAFERPKLRAVYEAMGFEYVGEKQVGQFHVALYELPLFR